MSWGPIAVTSTAQADLDAKLAEASAAYQHNLEAADYDLDPAAKEQIDAAITAAKSLVASGVVGAGLVNVQLNGHANPDHKPVKGWANDVVTVTVSCADPQPTT